MHHSKRLILDGTRRDRLHFPQSFTARSSCIRAPRNMLGSFLRTSLGTSRSRHRAARCQFGTEPEFSTPHPTRSDRMATMTDAVDVFEPTDTPQPWHRQSAKDAKGVLRIETTRAFALFKIYLELRE